MISAGIAVLTGSLLASFFPFRIDIYWLSLLPICLYLAYINTRWRSLWLLPASFLWATGHCLWQLDQRLDDDLNNKRLVVVGEVINIPARSAESSRFEFELHRIEGRDGKLPRLIRLSWRNAPDSLAPGQVWRLHVKLKKPHGYQNPGGFDYERWMFVRGIHASGYVLTKSRQEMTGFNKLSLNNIRYRLNNRIQQICSACSNTGLIQALALGYRGNITDADRQMLQQTGTAHLIAISGLHIGIIAGVFYALGLFLWNRLFYNSRLQRKEFALFVSFVAALVYSLMAGFELPAQRAILMLSVFMISLWSRSAINLLNTILITLLAVLVVSPLAVLSASFWLSFSALFIIALGLFLLRSQASRFRQLLVIQLLFSLLFIPISIVIFGQVHVASLFANLVAVPLISFVVVPVNFLLLTLVWLPQAWLEPLYFALDKLLGLLLLYLESLQDMGLQAQALAVMDGARILLIALLLLLIILPRGIMSRMWVFMLALIIIWPSSKTLEDKLSMTVLDVGMGTSIVIRTRNHSLVYDFGPGNDRGYSLGKWVLMPYLSSLGIPGPERIIISHADQDHVGGLYAIQSRLQYQRVYSGTPEKVKARFPDLGNVLDCHQQPPWRWDGVEFEFLSAGVKQTHSENNRSCVLRIKSDGHTLLVSGDIESAQEQRLVQSNAEQLQAQILIAPHHGSLTSSSARFIRAVNAKNVIFTAGYLNRWGFPRAEVIQRYSAMGAATFRTDDDGAVLINCRAQQCDIQRYRQLRPRLWY